MSTNHVKRTEVLCKYVSLKQLNVNQSTEEKDSRKYLNSTQCSTSLLLKTCKKWQAAKSSDPDFKSKIEVHLIARQEIQTSVRIIHQNVQPEPTDHCRCCAAVHPGLERLINDKARGWFCHLFLTYIGAE